MSRNILLLGFGHLPPLLRRKQWASTFWDTAKARTGVLIHSEDQSQRTRPYTSNGRSPSRSSLLFELTRKEGFCLCAEWDQYSIYLVLTSASRQWRIRLYVRAGCYGDFYDSIMESTSQVRLDIHLVLGVALPRGRERQRAMEKAR